MATITAAQVEHPVLKKLKTLEVGDAVTVKIKSLSDANLIGSKIRYWISAEKLAGEYARRTSKDKKSVTIWKLQ